MKDIFLQYGQGYLAGFAGFVTILMFFISIYKEVFSENEIINHKNFLLKNLTLFSNIPFKHIGKKSALFYTYLCEKVLGKPTKYKIYDRIFWNYKSTLLYIIFACFLVIYSTSQWSHNYYEYYPILILVLNFIVFSLGIIIEERKAKALNSQYNTNSYHAIMILIYGQIYSFFWSLLFWLSKYLNQYDAMITPFITFSLFFLYSSYYIFGVYILSISRIYIRAIAHSPSISNTIFIIFKSVLIFILVLVVSSYLSDYIIKIHSISHNNEHNILNLTNHHNIIFATLITPFVIYILIAIIEITTKFFLAPLQFLVKIFFNFLIKRNIYIYLFGSGITYLLIKIFR